VTSPPPGAAGAAATIAALLEQHREALVRWTERHAYGVLRFESAEDLVQGAALRALQAAPTYEHRGDAEFLGWMVTVARHHLSDRRAWWRTLKRDAGRVVRVTSPGGGESVGGGDEPPAARTGPVTFADRRDRIARAARALAALPERDADLVRQVVNDVSVAETAERLGVTYEAAQRARLRAVERLRKLATLAERG
jgi:RNA polymerase sigma factor (sigma-70 family)